jgi:H+/Cl- antiporter ClcA
MTLPMIACKRRLAALWFGGAGILFFILLFQSIFGRYGERASDAWSWLLPTIMPTLSLVIGVLVMDALGKGISVIEVDAFLFKLTFGISTAYLVAVLSLFLFQPFTNVSPFELMSQSNLWLGPFQGLVAGAMGAFFVKAPQGKGKSVKNKPLLSASGNLPSDASLRKGSR